jgi:predicted XRE-type DNA-binding protein
MLLLESKKFMDRTIFEESSGNVFADLGFDNADKMLMRGKIKRSICCKIFVTTGLMVLPHCGVFLF